MVNGCFLAEEEKGMPAEGENNSSHEGNTEPAISSEDLDKIRERTFDGEFKDLVEKVAGSDEEDSQVLSEGDEQEDILLRKLHDLFYKAGNLLEARNINFNFDPFVFMDNVQGSLIHNITRSFSKISLGRFALLSYHFEEKCLKPVINNIQDLDGSNIIIDIGEGLFREITDSDQGIFIDQEQALSNTYLKKRFVFIREKSREDLLYMVSLRTFVFDLIEELSIGELFLPSIYFFPVLIVQFPRGAYSPDDIYRKIKNSLNIQLLLYTIELYRKTTEITCTTFDQLIFAFDYFTTAFSRSRNGRIITMRFRHDEMHALFVMEHFLRKLEMVLTSNSVIAHVLRNTIVIFTFKKEAATVLKLVDEFNELFDLIEYKQLELSDRIVFAETVKEYIFP